MPESIVAPKSDPSISFSKTHWVVSISSSGGDVESCRQALRGDFSRFGFGHSKIIVEGLVPGVMSNQYILYTFDISYNDGESLDGTRKYRVYCNGNNVAIEDEDCVYNEADYLSMLDPDPQSKRYVEKIGLRKFFEGRNSRGMFLPVAEVQAMIERIHVELELNNAYHEQRELFEQRRAELFRQAGQEFCQQNTKANADVLQHDALCADEAANRDAIDQLRLDIGRKLLQANPSQAYVNLQNELAAWVNNNDGYDPSYSTASVKSAADSVSMAHNCATWCQENTMGRLPSSSASVGGDSLPVATAPVFDPSNRKYWLAGGAALLIAGGMFASRKPAKTLSTLVEKLSNKVFGAPR